MGEEIKQVRVVQGNDSMSLMLDIWLAGYLSGALSGAVTVLSNEPPTIEREQIADWAHGLAHKLQDKTADDPLMRETIRGQIEELLRAGAGDSASAEVHIHSEQDDLAAGGDGQ